MCWVNFVSLYLCVMLLAHRIINNLKNWQFFCIHLYYAEVIVICIALCFTTEQTGCTCIESLAHCVFPCVNNWIENWKTASFSSASARVWGNKNISCLNSMVVVYRQFSHHFLYAAHAVCCALWQTDSLFCCFAIMGQMNEMLKQEYCIIILIFQFLSTRTCLCKPNQTTLGHKVQAS